MCKYTVTTYTCECISCLHEPCAMKNSVEFPHFLRCSVIEESWLSEKKCSKCRRMKAGAGSATPKETKSQSLGSPHGGNMRKLMAPILRPPMFAPPTPIIVQPTNVNPRVAVNPLRENTPREHPLRQHQIQRKLVARTNETEDQLFFDEKLSTANAAHKAESETRQLPNHESSRHAQYHNSAAAQQNAELCFDDQPSTAITTKASQNTTKPISHQASTRPLYHNSAAASDKLELFFDLRQTQERASAIAPQGTHGILNHASLKPRSSPPTNLTPKLQSYAPYRPTVDTTKLSSYLNETATRPQHPLNFADEEALFFEYHAESRTTVRQATAAALQQVELAPSVKPEIGRMPSCLVPGPRKEPSNPPKQPTLRRKKSFDNLSFAQVPAHVEFRRPWTQEPQQIPAHQAKKEAARPQIAKPMPLNTTPKLTKVQIALSPNQANSRGGPGWEVFSPLSPLASAPRVVRKKRSPPGALNTRAYLQTQASASVLATNLDVPRTQRAVPRIPSLQRISALKFDGTLLEGVAKSMRPIRQGK